MAVTDSILNSVKKLCGLDPSIDAFDPDLIININAALGTLSQLGIGPENGFFITDDTTTYQDFLGPDKITQTNLVKQYLYFKVRLAFDTSSMSGSMMTEMRKAMEELEWRLNVQFESGEEGTGTTTRVRISKPMSEEEVGISK